MTVNPSLVIILFMVLGVTVHGAYGHGTGYELTPAVPLGDSMVVLEISSLPSDDGGTEMRFSLFDANSMITIRGVTYEVAATKGDAHLFNQTFESRDGTLVLLFKGGDSEIVISEEKRGGFFESIIGLDETAILVRGSPFNTGGLYKFQIEVTEAASQSQAVFNAGISVPEDTIFILQDPDLGDQRATVTTYYDEIADFTYERGAKSISFSMPFEWSMHNIDQTPAVHEEVTIQKTFADLLVSRYDLRVNGMRMPERVITVDDYAEERIIHLVINQHDLYQMLEENRGGNAMEFLLAPHEDAVMGMAARNGQFRITLDWEPSVIRSDSETHFFFNITDAFLGARTVTDYDLQLVQGDRVIAQTSGVSSELDHIGGEFAAFIPGDVSGLVFLRFENLGGNSLASLDMPLIVDRQEAVIPDWIKRGAGWWAEGRISDLEFASSLGYLVANGIIHL